MAFQLSPGVLVTEKDLTSIVPAVATSTGAFAGAFQWGPVGQVTTVESENRLVEILENNDWCLQMDDELPKKLIVGEKYKIPIGVYHRVIKGTGDLKIKLQKL